MRVLMHMRADGLTHRGGDVIQLRRWTYWLRRAGVQVTLTADERPNLTGYDLVHLNNAARASELWPTLAHCQAFGVPTVLTTLYWPDDDYEQRGRPGWLGRLFGLLPPMLRQRCKSLLRLARQPSQWRRRAAEVWHGTRHVTERMLTGVDMLLAVGRPEAEILRAWLPDQAIAIVPSGVDAIFCSDEIDLWADEDDTPVPSADGFIRFPVFQRTGVLCVGRFDPQKGQHRLIQALRGLDVPITLVGPDNPNYPGYRNYCRKIAGRHVCFLPPQDQLTLKLLYQTCKVHAQASWYELSSLSALEAAACGAAVVTTSQGCMRDYLGAHAQYVDPDDAPGLWRAVLAGLAEPVSMNLAHHVRERYTWRHSTEQLLTAYEQVLALARFSRAAA